MFGKPVAALVPALLLALGCVDDAEPPTDPFGSERYLTLTLTGDTVLVPFPEGSDPSAVGVFDLDIQREVYRPFSTEAVQSGDSLVWSRYFPLGGGSVLVLTGTAGDVSRVPILRSILSRSHLRRWHGLRTVMLSDVTADSIDRQRDDSPREAPLVVTHSVSIRFSPAVAESSLIVVDSLSFSGNNSIVLSVNREVPGTLEAVEGVVTQISAGRWLCTSDSLSSGGFKGVFSGVFTRNWYSTDPSTGELLGRSRMNSALLGGSFIPVGEQPNRFDIEVTVPTGMQIFAPLPLMSSEHGGSVSRFSTGSGLVRGVVPVFMGGYHSSYLSDGRSRLLVQTGIGDDETALDSLWADNMSALLQSMLGFSGSTFSILIVEGASESFMTPYHGCLVVSPGVLEDLSGVFSWGDSLAAGAPATGTSVVAAGAKCFTLQSIFMDPVLAEMIQAWMPCRFLAFMSLGEDLFKMRRAYRNYYLYQTGIMGGIEPSLADPSLPQSPLYDPVVRGKGPIVLEYLHSQGCLDYLPNLLDNLRHSGSYWSKIWANLGLYEGERRYRLVRQFLYQPGIPQIDVEWWIEDGLLKLVPSQMQPTAEYGVLFRYCKLYLDTGVQHQLILNPGDGDVLYAVLPSDASEGVLAIDLNTEEVIPADIVYRRRPSGGE